MRQHLRIVSCGGFSLVALLVAALASVGCAPPKYTDYDTFMKKPRPIVGGKPYVIEPPDTIRIISPNAPEINNVSVTIRPDGYITLYLLGDLFVAGKTPTQLSSEIEEKILKYYQDATIQIEVIGFNSKFYYLAGEIDMGPKPYTGRETVLDAVLKGGVARSSWPEHLVVLRPNEEEQLVRRMTINFLDMIEKGDLRYNAVVEEGDILFMPINPLAAIGVAVQNLLSPVNPLIQAASTPKAAGAAAGF
ncbi:MAG: polysaccharide biosynthesis/export family protein [Planctomycetes bacterium]|nr:polysaccharide biosynthesis/export family protein [Planctomycetota bacterium]